MKHGYTNIKKWQEDEEQAVKKLLNDFKEKRKYCKLKKRALNRNLWWTHFGKGYGPVATDSFKNEQTKLNPTVLTCTIFVCTLHVSFVSTVNASYFTFPT